MEIIGNRRKILFPLLECFPFSNWKIFLYLFFPSFVSYYSVIVIVTVIVLYAMFILVLWTELEDKHWRYHYDCDCDRKIRYNAPPLIMRLSIQVCLQIAQHSQVPVHTQSYVELYLVQWRLQHWLKHVYVVSIDQRYILI